VTFHHKITQKPINAFVVQGFYNFFFLFNINNLSSYRFIVLKMLSANFALKLCFFFGSPLPLKFPFFSHTRLFIPSKFFKILFHSSSLKLHFSIAYNFTAFQAVESNPLTGSLQKLHFLSLLRPKTSSRISANQRARRFGMYLYLSQSISNFILGIFFLVEI